MFNINFEKLYYTCGEQVNGTISWICHEAAPSGCIQLKLSGKENVVIKDTEKRERLRKEYRNGEYFTKSRNGNREFGNQGPDNNSTFGVKRKYWQTNGVKHDDNGISMYEDYQHEVEFKEKKSIINYEFKVYEFQDGMMAPGQFKIPFSFVLPSGLPSSFNHEWKTWGPCVASIVYTAKLKLSGTKEKLIEKNFFISWLPPQAENKEEDLKKEVTKKVKCFFCCAKGDYQMTCYAEKSAYSCGDHVWMIAEVKNNTDKPIKHVYALLQRKLRVSAQKKIKNIDLNEKGVDGGSVEANEEKVGSDAIRLGCSSKMTATMLNSGPSYSPTCDGSLIKCDYFIQARFTPGIYCNCSGDAFVEFPIKMICPEVPHQIFELNGWGQDVQEMPAYVALFTPEHAIDKTPSLGKKVWDKMGELNKLNNDYMSPGGDYG